MLGSPKDKWSIESLCRAIEQRMPLHIQRDSIVVLGSQTKFAAKATTDTQEPPFRILVNGHAFIDLSEGEYQRLKTWTSREEE